MVPLAILSCSLSTAQHYQPIPQFYQDYQNNFASPGYTTHDQLNKLQKRDTSLGLLNYNQLKANPSAFVEKKVTTLKHQPRRAVPFKIGKPIYSAPSTFQFKNNIPFQSTFGFNNKLGISNNVHQLIPTNFNIKNFADNNLQLQGNNYKFDLSAFKTSSALPAPDKANDIQIPSFYKPSELSFNTNNQYKLHLPQHFSSTPNLIQTADKPIHLAPEVPLKFDTFVPGISDTHNIGKGHEYHELGNGNDPNSHVKVTNGKVTYEYKIRHFLNKH